MIRAWSCCTGVVLVIGAGVFLLSSEPAAAAASGLYHERACVYRGSQLRWRCRGPGNRVRDYQVCRGTAARGFQCYFPIVRR